MKTQDMITRLRLWSIPVIIACFVVTITMATDQLDLPGCTDRKYCYYEDPISGESIFYIVGKSGLKNGECPPTTDKKLHSSCHIINYKTPEARYIYKDCLVRGQNCEKNEDCCQSHANFKALDLSMTMFSNCYNGKCVVCLNTSWPCGFGSKIPCCGALDPSSDIKCRGNHEVSYSPYLKTEWSICSPAPCNQPDFKKHMLYNVPCVYGKGHEQYNGVNLCKCGSGHGYQCQNGNKCVGCKLEGFGENSQCVSDEDCCKHHECKSKSIEGIGPKECVQRKDCVLEDQRNQCESDGKKCCDGLKCLIVTGDDKKKTRLYSICAREKCTQEAAPCEVNYHCCEKEKGLSCIKQKKKSLYGKSLKICTK